MTKIAVIQQPSEFMDRPRTIKRAVECINSAGQQGADLVVFCETFVPGYPAWLWRLRPGTDWTTNDALYRRLLQNAVDVSTDQLQPIYEAAKKNAVTVTIGIEEIDNQASRGTLYNSYLTISSEGELINVHRKLMPTNPERMVWGTGDASGLKVIDTPAGRLGSLICWENYMPLARHTLYAQGVQLYLAPTYDSGDGWLGTLQHIAREGRCFVIGCGNLIQAQQLPDDFPERETLYPDPEEWVNPGGSVIIAPEGRIIAGPLLQEAGILYADIALEDVAASKRTLDVAGHYARSDVFQLTVNQQKQPTLSLR